jgi:hypothetical protein
MRDNETTRTPKNNRREKEKTNTSEAGSVVSVDTPYPCIRASLSSFLTDFDVSHDEMMMTPTTEESKHTLPSSLSQRTRISCLSCLQKNVRQFSRNKKRSNDKRGNKKERCCLTGVTVNEDLCQERVINRGFTWNDSISETTSLQRIN